MPDDTERLLVALEARVTQFEKDMKRAEKTGTSSYTNLRRGSRTATQQMEADMVRSTTRINQALAATSTKIGVFGKAFAGGLIGGIAAGGITGIVSGFREIASSVADIGSEAQKAGLSTKAFQELKFVAEQNRISVDALTDGMKELQLRTDEFILSAGKSGSAAESFKRLGYTVNDLKAKIKDPSALLTELIGKVQKLDKAAQIRLFDELFGGTGGEQFVRLIGQGEKGIRDQIKAANDLGVVLDDDVIKKAAEVDKKFNEIAATIGGNLKTAVVDAFTYLANFVDRYRDIQNQSNRTLDDRTAELGMKRLEIERQILELQDKQREGTEKLSDTARNLGFENSQNSNVAGYTGQIAALREQLQGVADEEKQIVDERNKRPVLAPVTVPSSSGTYSGGTPVSSSSSSKRPDALQRQIDSLREHTEALKAETEAQQGLNPLIDDYGFAVEKAAAKQQLMNAAKDAGKTVTPELAAEIEKLSTAYANAAVAGAKLNESQDKIRERAEEMVALQKDVASGFIDAFVSGKSAADAALESLKKIGDYLINDFLDSIFTVKNAGSGGGIFSFLGSLFGGVGGGAASAAPSWLNNGFDAYADGGVANRPSIFAEAGPEAAVPLPDGRRIPVDLGNSGGGSQVTADVRVFMDDNGNWQAEVSRISQQQAAKTINAWSGSKSFVGSVGKAATEASRRGMR